MKIVTELVKSYPRNIVNNLTADYHVKPHHAAF